MKRLFPLILTIILVSTLSSFPCWSQDKEQKRAIVVLDSPDTMRPWGENAYRWDAVFKETGGKSWFEVKSTDFYIQTPSGNRWSNGWAETHIVKAGGSENVDYTIEKDYKWAGGKFHCVWIGTDEFGNSIRIVQEVKIPK